MLIYSHMKDPFHTTLRMSVLIEINGGAIEKDRLCIYDLVLSAPSILKNCTLPSSSKRLKIIRKSTESPYIIYENNSKLYFNQSKTQNIALRLMLGYGLISKISFKAGLIEITDFESWKKVNDIAFESASIDRSIANALTEELRTIPLYGKNGLKDRFNVMEHKYDAA